MQFYTHDVAIEFNAVFSEVERTIKRYTKVGIDVSKEHTEVLKIKEETETRAFNSCEEGELESVYMNGCKELKRMSKSLEKHEVYYSMFNGAAKIQRNMGNKMPQRQELSEYGKATIELIKSINDSDTRHYAAEKKIVEKVYKVAYNVIQMELIESGHSCVLEWIKSDEVTKSLIINLIEKDVESLTKKGIDIAVLNDLTTPKNEHEPFTYLNEELIIFLALQNKKSLNQVTNTLFDIVGDVTTSESNKKTQNASIEEIKNRLKEISGFLKKNRIFKNLGILISLIAALIAAKYSIDEAVEGVGYREYRTYPDYYTSNPEIINREFPEYMKKIKGWEKTTVKAYTPWARENVLYGDYTRKTIEYDLTDTQFDELSEVLDLDFSSLSHSNPKIETLEDINPDELYEDTIVEIIRLTQNEGEDIFVPNETWQLITKILLSIIAYGLLGGGCIIEIREIAKKFKNSGEYKKLKKEELLKIESLVEKYREFCEENETFRQQFISIYERISKYMSNTDLEDHYKQLKFEKKINK